MADLGADVEAHVAPEEQVLTREMVNAILASALAERDIVFQKAIAEMWVDISKLKMQMERYDGKQSWPKDDSLPSAPRPVPSRLTTPLNFPTSRKKDSLFTGLPWPSFHCLSLWPSSFFLTPGGRLQGFQSFLATFGMSFPCLRPPRKEHMQ